MDSVLTLVEGDIEEMINAMNDVNEKIKRFERSLEVMRGTLKHYQDKKNFLNNVKEDYKGWRVKLVNLGMLFNDESHIMSTHPETITVGEFTKYPSMRIVEALRFTQSSKMEYLFDDRWVDVVNPPQRSPRKFKRGTTSIENLWVREWCKMVGDEIVERGIHGCVCTSRVLRIVDENYCGENYYFNKWVSRKCQIKCDRHGKLEVTSGKLEEEVTMVDRLHI